MGTTLTGTTPQDTYDSLIKVTDNGPLSGTAKYLSDGLGNDSVLALSTSRVGVGTASPAALLTLQDGNVDNVSGSKLRMVMGPNPYWEIQANNGGVAADRKLVFNTSASAGNVLTLTQEGNVGIGTSSPFQAAANRTVASINGITSSVLNLGVNNSLVTYLFVGAGGSTFETAGSNTISASGANPIIFNTNAVERVRILSSGGITFNGDTAAANALDDYEEGTWTLGLSFGGGTTGITYIFNTGNYTKIGRQVNVTGWVRLSSKGSSTGTARITGLPFTNGATSEFYTGVTLGYIDFISFADIPNAYVETNATTIFMKQTANAGAMSDLTDANFANNSSLMINATYYV